MESHAERQKPKTYHHGDLRNALIQAGLGILAEGGAQELDLRKVARRAGVSHAAPYRHFADKQALIAAINEEGFHLLAERIRSSLREVTDEPLEQLLGVALAYVRFAQENPWLMREMFSGITIERETFGSLHTASKSVYQQRPGTREDCGWRSNRVGWRPVVSFARVGHAHHRKSNAPLC
jgi:AcrR family transcriptional regulator